MSRERLWCRHAGGRARQHQAVAMRHDTIEDTHNMKSETMDKETELKQALSLYGKVETAALFGTEESCRDLLFELIDVYKNRIKDLSDELGINFKK